MRWKDRPAGTTPAPVGGAPNRTITRLHYNDHCEDDVLIRRLHVSGLLSFGRSGIDLPLQGLNVLIGPNGSGKSNLLEVLALLRASPRSISELVRSTGGVSEWLWKGESSSHMASICAHVDYPIGNHPIRHLLQVIESAGLPAVGH